MVVVRYASLVALVVWLGVMQSAVFFDRPDYGDWLEYVCGGTIVVGLFALKFVGPPPRAFPGRVAIAFLMLCIAVFAQYSGASIAATAINMTLGFILLAWYAHE